MVEYVRACIGQQFLHRNFVVCCVNIYCVILVCSFIPKSHFSRPELYQSLFSSSIEIALILGKRKSWKVKVFALKNWRWNLHIIQHLSKDTVQQLASWRTCLIVDEDRMHSFVKNRFKLMDIFWTFLPLVALSDPSFAVLIEMERLPSFPTDDFLLPDSLCPSFRPSCGLFKAHPLGGCWCSCPNTFSFYEEDFQCEQNSEARRNAGMFCDLRLF